VLYSKVVLLIVVEWARDRYRIQYYMLRARQIYLEERRNEQHDWFAYQARELYHPSESDGTGRSGGNARKTDGTGEQTNVVPMAPREKGTGP
jgi:hypothetical protein